MIDALPRYRIVPYLETLYRVQVYKYDQWKDFKEPIEKFPFEGSRHFSTNNEAKEFIDKELEKEQGYINRQKRIALHAKNNPAEEYP